MCPEGIESMTDEDKKSAIENFMKVYMQGYRDYLAKKDVDERHLPSVYKGFPFVVEAYLHPNLGVTVLLKKSSRSRILVVDGEYEEIRDKIVERSFDYMQTFPPFTRWTEDEAERISQIDADRDLANSRRLELLGSIESHMDDILTESDKMLKLNPWLDEQSKAQAEKVDRAKALITELYKEIETDDEERFSRYGRELMEIQAFEMAEMEIVASEMEMEVETAVEEIEEQFTELEAKMDDIRDSMNDSIDGLRKKIQDLSKKVDSVESGSDKDDDLYDKIMGDIKELRNDAQSLTKKHNKLEKELGTLKTDLTISEEIKDTVFRDSKRIHNLNERTTDLEKNLEKLSGKKGKKTEDEVKALIKRFDKLDTELSKMVKKAVDYEMESRPPVVVQEAPPPEPISPPKGATVKRTTKKKTTKKTKKKA